MAVSRTERIGTIFSRVTALLKGGSMMEQDLPIWYAIYKAFPPKNEPIFIRRPSQQEIPNIFYKEDELRAKFHKDIEYTVPADMMNDKLSQFQGFLDMYNTFPKSKVAEEDLYKKVLIKYKLQFTLKNYKNFNASAKSESESDFKYSKT